MKEINVMNTEKLIESIVISDELQKSNPSAVDIINIVRRTLNKLNLTDNQKTVLELTSKGLNQTQIAKKLNVSVQNIQKIKRRITFKVIKHLDSMEVFF